ncbi:PREDICTED: protein PLANT CADMIUM RESISTANCE 7-like [Nelumbo nucifera]|uniref:Protein PLANT CADMIUM RESISTANCE 7-like n=1 Tax=Nelumbo nucifera TaxID=4432 RepID=A0A1U8AZV7_NELNU|nr:PREDICTED: protein PLANT CADMIUM RESISTANCE 7-like [Nelumbo nucifera]
MERELEEQSNMNQKSRSSSGGADEVVNQPAVNFAATADPVWMKPQRPSSPAPYPPPSTASNIFPVPAAQQGIPIYPPPTPPLDLPQQWSTSLWACYEDPENCIVTGFCPCVTFGRIAEILDRGGTSFRNRYSRGYRTKLRRLYNLQEAPYPDWLVHFFCSECALCQEYRELKNHGIDPTKGWQDALERQMKAGVIVPPTVEGAMTR